MVRMAKYGHLGQVVKIELLSGVVQLGIVVQSGFTTKAKVLLVTGPMSGAVFNYVISRRSVSLLEWVKAYLMLPKYLKLIRSGIKECDRINWNGTLMNE